MMEEGASFTVRFDKKRGCFWLKCSDFQRKSFPLVLQGKKIPRTGISGTGYQLNSEPLAVY